MANRIPGLRDWITRRGYPLETRVAMSLSKAGFFVSRGNLYSDPGTGTLREIDVTASLASKEYRTPSGVILTIQVTLVVECKHVEDKSWVVFSQPAHIRNGRELNGLLSNRLGSRLLFIMAEGSRPPKLQTLDLGELVGYDLRAGPTSKQDEPDHAHAAYSQVLSAARARASRTSVDEGRSWKHADLVVPVIVIDGALYECVPGPGEEPSLKTIRRGVVLTQSWEPRIPDSVVHVVTAEDLPAFSASSYQDAKLLLERDVELLEARRSLVRDEG